MNKTTNQGRIRILVGVITILLVVTLIIPGNAAYASKSLVAEDEASEVGEAEAIS